MILFVIEIMLRFDHAESTDRMRSPNMISVSSINVLTEAHDDRGIRFTSRSHHWNTRLVA